MSPEALALLAVLATNPLQSYTNGPTYTKDIKPVLEKHCTMCHNKNTTAWADWTVYENVYGARLKIKSRVWTQRNMPPGGGSITDKERSLIKDWVDTGAKK